MNLDIIENHMPVSRVMSQNMSPKVS